MGLGGISIWQLLIILAIVVLIFGTKRLKGIGGDLGGAIKSFRKAVTDEEAAANKDKEPDQVNQQATSDDGTAQTEKTETRQP